MNYGFICECQPPNRAQFYVPGRHPSRCRSCDGSWRADVVWPEGTIVTDVVLSPEQAGVLLSSATDAATSAINDQIVDSFRTKMVDGTWVGMTIATGGEHHPVLVRNNQVHLGTQRLKACVLSGVPLETVLVEMDS